VNCVSLGLRCLAKFACYSFGLPSNGCGVLTGLLLGILCLELVVLDPLGRDLLSLPANRDGLCHCHTRDAHRCLNRLGLEFVRNSIGLGRLVELNSCEAFDSKRGMPT
tara:strand:+ start:272 stop:595 length:324 start_codon:yes stop_codon:yes gene_type:complete